MSIEEAVNSNLLALRLVERAIHRPSGWSLRCGSIEVPAQVSFSNLSLTVKAQFPSFPEEIGLPSQISIFHEGEQVWVRPVRHDGHEGFIVEWTWEVEDKQAVAA